MTRRHRLSVFVHTWWPLLGAAALLGLLALMLLASGGGR